MKTNKSYTKRLKVTKNGKILRRAGGQDHYNAKESGRKSLKRNGLFGFTISNKAKDRFLPNS